MSLLFVNFWFWLRVMWTKLIMHVCFNVGLHNALRRIVSVSHIVSCW